VNSSGPNASTRERVLLPGTLAQSGVVANCIILAIKVTIPKLGIIEYVDAELALAPPHLPDGQYELQFDGRMLKVMNAAGIWASSDPRATPPLVTQNNGSPRSVTSCATSCQPDATQVGL
jgi:hypothetical protein